MYSADAAGNLSPVLRSDPAMVYVPNSMSNTVDVISQRTLRIVGHFAVPAEPQHVTPAWDLRTLYVDSDRGNSLTPVDPLNGRPRGRPIHVRDPYNLYFTPDGRRAIVVAEAQRRLDFRDARSMRLRRSVAIGCVGVDHMDFSAGGSLAYATCEFDGMVLELSLRTLKVVRRLRLHGGAASPQDIKLSPDGRVLYVADQRAGGLWEIDPQTLRKIGFLRTGLGAHGLYPSRDASLLFASNRAEGSVSVISFAARRVLRKWRLPAGSSPDMGGVSADGGTLWLSGRYSSEVYAIDTQSGRLRARIKVGQGPHGLSVWPQPGRYSLGHTGITR